MWEVDRTSRNENKASSTPTVSKSGACQDSGGRQSPSTSTTVCSMRSEQPDRRRAQGCASHCAVVMGVVTPVSCRAADGRAGLKSLTKDTGQAMRYKQRLSPFLLEAHGPGSQQREAYRECPNGATES